MVVPVAVAALALEPVFVIQYISNTHMELYTDYKVTVIVPDSG